MASGDIRSINLRLNIPRTGNIMILSNVLLATGLDPDLFTFAGIEKSRFTGDELAEYIITLVEI